MFSSLQSHRYSIQITPSPTICESINVLKLHLQTLIGNYEGLQTKAHISLFNFQGKETTYYNWQKHLNTSDIDCSLILRWNKIAFFSNGSLVLLPDEESFDAIQNIMATLLQQKPSPVFAKMKYPHITIGRKIDRSLWQAINEDFTQAINIEIKDWELSILKFDKALGRYL